jgi:hypothetical protein
VIRQALLCLLALTLTGLAFAADDPPTLPEEKPDLIIKKKKKPEPEVKPKEADPKAKPKFDPKDKTKLDPKDDPKDKTKLDPKDDEPGAEPKEGVDAKDIMERITKNIRDSEQRLRKQDPGDGTRQVQRDIVKDLNSLIEKAQQPPPSGGGGSASSDPNSKDQPMPQQGQQGQQADGSRSKRSERNKMGQATQSSQHNTGGAGNDTPSNAPDRRIDVSQGRGPSLPEMARQEMDAYLREEFAIKYTDLLKQYYQTIAEKSRRTEEKR